MGLLNTVHREKDGKKEPTRFYSSKQEKSVAKKFSGNVTKNSGATMFQKGDVMLDKFLVECKTKTSPSESITIHKEWLDKNEKEALFMGKPYSTLAFNFGLNQKNYYIIDESLFETLLNALENEND